MEISADTRINASVCPGETRNNVHHQGLGGLDRSLAALVYINSDGRHAVEEGMVWPG